MMKAAGSIGNMASFPSTVCYLWALSLLCSCVWFEFGAAYSAGAPVTSCSSMKPDHGSPSNNPSPFESLPNQTEIFSNESVILTIQSSTSKTFKGFLIMGFDAATDSVIGTFNVDLSQGQSQTLKCFDTYDTAATHRSSTGKKSVTVEWTPPADFEGVVIFKTTFAESKSTYWDKQISPEVIITRLDTAVSSTIDPLLTTEKPAALNVYDGCGISKGCIATPSGCIDLKTCTMMTTYQTLNDDYLQLEIYGQITGDEYVAIGFSTDRKMGDDSVVECVNNRNTLTAYPSFNTPDKINARIESQQLPGFNLTSSAFIDGFIHCKFQYPIRYTVNGIDFDLSQPYYLLMASGPTGDYNIQEHSTEESSSSSLTITTALKIQYFNEASRVLKQLHGSFMVIAWLMAASVGMLMPRYMKKTWVGKKFMKKDLWFVCHQGLMVLAWTLTVIGFIIIFIDVDGWVSESVSENPHPLIGCITTVLAFIQPFMALMRPMPNAPNRYIFNWAHMLVGYSAHILAITCIFLAVEMEEAELPYETYWILTAHICCYVGAHLLLTYLANRNNKNPGAVSKEGPPKDYKGSSIRKGILAGYVCVVVGLGITVIAFIAGA
ncbi:putative ferric-chelate reductase 1 homolog [Daphnia pulicaria]|uniref:putative ferric-chelate reductase 1 homolog n=1 Tax=Daphnia pulicaria TaxID=35523 RepID=UPI001EEAE138|nr:putative ferric-chelate reductase 1 homolog [Daphnia pulicaria]